VSTVDSAGAIIDTVSTGLTVVTNAVGPITSGSVSILNPPATNGDTDVY